MDTMELCAIPGMHCGDVMRQQRRINETNDTHCHIIYRVGCVRFSLPYFRDSRHDFDAIRVVCAWTTLPRYCMVWGNAMGYQSVCKHDTICGTYGPTNSQVVPRLTHRASRGGVLVLRLSWGGKRTVSPRRGSDRMVVHSGHSTLVTPASRIAAGTSAIMPRNTHLLTGVALMPAPTGSRAGARSIRRLGVVCGVVAEDACGGMAAGGSSALLVAAPAAVRWPRAVVPSNCCNW